MKVLEVLVNNKEVQLGETINYEINSLEINWNNNFPEPIRQQIWMKPKEEVRYIKNWLYNLSQKSESIIVNGIIMSKEDVNKIEIK